MDNEDNALVNEQRLMRMMRKTLTSIVRDTAPRTTLPTKASRRAPPPSPRPGPLPAPAFTP